MRTTGIISQQVLLKAFAILLGFSSAIAQLLVMRELVTVFYGNEFAYAFALASWLVGIALGAWGGNMWAKQPRAVSVLLLLNSLLIPLTILFIRLIRYVMALPTGQIIDLFPIAGLSFLVLLPLTMGLGALFSALVRRSEGEGINVYILETFGFMVGGLLFSLVFIHVAWPFEMALGLTFLFLIGYVFFTRNWTGWLSLFLATWILGAFTVGYLARGDIASRGWQWPGYSLLAAEDSPYGSLALLKRGREESLFENGQHVFTTNDRMTAEDAAHFALLAHASPHRVLLIGGGPSGVVSEILKHPDTVIDYVELDPAVVRMAARLPFAKVSWLRDNRVRVYNDDALRFIRRERSPRYDAVIVNVGDPATLFTNRFYTEDFFRDVSRVMNKNGILYVGISSGENYISEEGRAYLRSIHSTMCQVFSQFAFVPGERYVFLAGPGPEKLVVSPDALTEHRRERKVDTAFVNESYLPARIEPGRVLTAEKILAKSGQVNSDRRPAGFLKALVFWSTHFEPVFSRIVTGFERWGWILWFAPVLLFLWAIARRKPLAAAAGPLVFVSGFVQMALQVVVILLFQSYYGYVYSVLGLVTAGFMFGAFGGALVAQKLWPVSRVRGMALGVQLIAAMYPLVFICWRSALPDAMAIALAMGLSCGAGCLGGLQFGLGNRLAKGKATSSLYALDVVGAALAAIFVSILLIPLWGVDRTVVFCAVLNLAVAGMFLIQRQTFEV